MDHIAIYTDEDGTPCEAHIFANTPDLNAVEDLIEKFNANPENEDNEIQTEDASFIIAVPSAKDCSLVTSECDDFEIINH
jgi:hypothetical protein